MAKPFLKWAGGKARLLPELRKHVPREYTRYVEPFLGGGALYFDLEPPVAYLADRNVNLVRTYLAICDGVDVRRGRWSLLELLQGYELAHRRDAEAFYYRQRLKWNEGDPFQTYGGYIELAAAFLYLNRASFNGLWRENRDGKMNSPMGRPAQGETSIADGGRLRHAHHVLCSSQTIFDCIDFADALSRTRPGDFVYCDPPYDPASDTASFAAYQAGGFRWDHQMQLAVSAATAVEKGAKILLSNADTKRVRHLYRSYGFRMRRVHAPRSISCDRGSRGDGAAELLIWGGYER